MSKKFINKALPNNSSSSKEYQNREQHTANRATEHIKTALFITNNVIRQIRAKLKLLFEIPLPYGINLRGINLQSDGLGTGKIHGSAETDREQTNNNKQLPPVSEIYSQAREPKDTDDYLHKWEEPQKTYNNNPGSNGNREEGLLMKTEAPYGFKQHDV